MIAEGSAVQNQNLPNKNESRSWAAFVFWLLIGVLLIAVDQFLKNHAPKVFFNSAFAFSLPLPPWLMYVIYFFVLVFMTYYCFKNYAAFKVWQSLAFTLIFAGALSNIGERIIFGRVKDFIYIKFLQWTGIYNLADFYILAGILLLLVVPIFYQQSKNL